ncbi:MAG TPA: serine hydrolase domain-containing protein, partial [Dokdonella sp.]
IFLLAPLFAVAAAVPPATAAAHAPAQTGVQGFSTQRLQRLDRFLREATDAHGYLGAVALVARHGEVVELRAFGHRDLARAEPMTTDAIFRIYSMSKTVTSVAALILMEEGRLALDDPIANYLPEFSAMQVLAGGSADAPQLSPATRPITIRQLLTHTAGFATGAAGEEVATQLLERADPHAAADLHGYAARLARVPLAAQPGTRFRYDGVQIEVLSRLIEVVARMPFDAFLQQRIFEPLRMRDTGFMVPPDQRGRIADISAMDAQGHLVLAEGPSAAHPGERLNAYSSGAGGLYSTAGDYLRFCQMLLDGGTLDGASILGRKSVDLMMQNQLTQFDPPVTSFSEAEGFGLGGSVVLDVARRGRLGSPGAFGWSGAASTYYTIDRQEQLVAILLLQHLPHEGRKDLPKLSVPFYNLVYQALQ